MNALALTRGPGQRNRLVAGTTWDTYGTDLSGNGLPASPDWGTSPRQGDPEAQTYFLGSVPGQPRVLFKVSDGPLGSFAVYRSDDGGETWVRKLKAEQVPTSLLVHPADPDSIYVGFRYFNEGQGLFISHDGGDTWRREPMDRAPLALAGDPSDPSRVYAGDLDGFYLSTDAGRHFARQHAVATTAIEVDPRNPRRIAFGGHALQLSTDGGETRVPATYQPLKLWVSDLAFGPRGDVYAATGSFYDAGLLEGGRGVLVSRDRGRSYARASGGLGTLDALSLAVGADGRVFVGLRGGGVYTAELGSR